MAQINVSNLSFHYEGSFEHVFEHVSMKLDTDWKLGFTGRNGRGKTTFLKLLLGEYAYSGSISAPVSFCYFPYPVLNPNKNTVQVLQEIVPNAQEWEFFKEFHALHIAEDVLYRPFSTLSPGEQTKALLGALFLQEDKFLLIDEPTNHLDEAARFTLGNYLNSKKGFILVSHDRALLDACTDHTLSINKTNIIVQKGNFSSWLEQKKQSDYAEQAANEKLEKEMKRLKIAARRTKNWSDNIERTKIGSHSSDRGFIGHKAAKMMQRAKNIEARKEKAIKEKEALLHNIEYAGSLKITPLLYQKQTLFTARDLSIHYGQKTIVSGLSFSIERGERVVLDGKNGAGKSSILKTVLAAAGSEKSEGLWYSGQAICGSRLICSYVPQSTASLRGTLQSLIISNGLEASLFFTILRKLDFSREQFEKPIELYSEGQKKKVLLAQSLAKPAHLYVWDEPLNYVDVLSRIQIEELIQTCNPTMLFVEHDAAFRGLVATSVITV